MFVLARALTYATIFIAFLLVLLPRELLSRSGIIPPGALGPLEILGIAGVLGGGALVLWCILAFAFIGKGTPAVFDPPRRLVIAGPYRFVRNPMYLGAVLGLLGAALFYRSLALLAYAVGFLLLVHLLVIWYEEPHLSQVFGEDYQAYRRAVRRWWPHQSPVPPH